MYTPPLGMILKMRFALCDSLPRSLPSLVMSVLRLCVRLMFSPCSSLLFLPRPLPSLLPCAL